MDAVLISQLIRGVVERILKRRIALLGSSGATWVKASSVAIVADGVGRR